MSFERFYIRRNSVWAPTLVFPFGATRNRSYVEIGNVEIAFHFGILFSHRMRLADVVSTKRIGWSWLAGIGWRSNFVGQIGLIGSREGVVEVRFSRKRWLWMGLPMPCDRIAVSLEQPDEFLAALQAATGSPSRAG
jgi:hypothetical protein